MRRLLLTGADGFIGRHCLPLLLAKGYEVHAVSLLPAGKNHPQLRWHQADLLNPGDVRELVVATKATHLLHLAWFVEHGKFWSAVENIRWVQASLDLFQAFVQAGGRRVLGVGSCAEYDWRYGYCSEQFTPLAPRTLYGTCKHCLQTMLGALAKETGLSEAWGRIFFLYGPHEHPNRFVPSVTRSLLSGAPVRCRSEDRVRDLLSVEDVASGLVAILESEVRGPINIASGHPTRLGEVVRKIAEHVGRADLIVHSTRKAPSGPDDPPLLVADTTRLMREVRWKPCHTLDSGIARTVRWWQDRLSPEVSGR